MSKDEIRTILENQLRLLAEASAQQVESCYLAEMTNSMLDTAAMILAFE